MLRIDLPRLNLNPRRENKQYEENTCRFRNELNARFYRHQCFSTGHVHEKHNVRSEKNDEAPPPSSKNDDETPQAPSQNDEEIDAEMNLTTKRPQYKY